ncbi:hypothetical protein [Streptomyces sp. ISID311]|uniref:hypothetical protein n=1 Tax=Streptomyces sp. ISID311 TaxID=2601673 RepID=UPI00164BB2B4|nr:hypothetical protein [Streptomyces sp. ISID311]
MAVFAAATLAARKERSLTAITAGVLTVQGALHLFFMQVQQDGAAASKGMRPSAAAAGADLRASRMMRTGHSVPRTWLLGSLAGRCGTSYATRAWHRAPSTRTPCPPCTIPVPG